MTNLQDMTPEELECEHWNIASDGYPEWGNMQKRKRIRAEILRELTAYHSMMEELDNLAATNFVDMGETMTPGYVIERIRLAAATPA
jgi:hypothetical protein